MAKNKKKEQGFVQKICVTKQVPIGDKPFLLAYPYPTTEEIEDGELVAIYVLETIMKKNVVHDLIPV